MYADGRADDAVSVWDTQTHRLVGHLAVRGSRTLDMAGLADGTTVALRREHVAMSGEPRVIPPRSLVRIDPSGAVSEYGTVLLEPGVTVITPRTRGLRIPIPGLLPHLRVAVSADGALYVAHPFDYEIAALDAMTGEVT